MAGKGDKQRGRQVPTETYEKNYDRIFGKKKHKIKVDDEESYIDAKGNRIPLKNHAPRIKE